MIFDSIEDAHKDIAIVSIGNIFGYSHKEWIFDTEVVQEMDGLSKWHEPKLMDRDSARTCNTSTIYRGTENMCLLWLKHSKSSKVYSGKTDKKEILKLFVSDKIVQGKQIKDKDWTIIKLGEGIKDDWEYRIEPDKFWLDADNMTEAFNLLKKDKSTKKWEAKDWFAAGIEASKKYES